MIRTLGYVSLVVFALSATAHLCTFIPAIPISMDFVWPLHLASGAVCAFLFWGLAAQQRKQSRPKVSGLVARWREANREGKEFWTRFYRFVPRKLLLLAVAYTMVNFLLFIFLMEGGGPSMENGQPILESHGHFIRALTPDEYQRFRAYEVRGFSGHWMFVSFLPMVYFLRISAKLRGEDQRQETDSPQSDAR